MDQLRAWIKKQSFAEICILTVIICLSLTAVGEAVYVTWWKTPNGDSMVDDVNDALRVTGVTVQAIGGNAAHDTANAQAPVVTGGHATSSVNGETLVTNGDAVRWHFGRDGVPITRNGCPVEDLVPPAITTITASTTSTQIIAAQAAGVKLYLYSIVVANTSTTATTVTIRDGNGGTGRLVLPVPGNSAGVVYNPPVPVSGFTAATRMDAQATDPVSSLYITALACKSQL